MAAGSLQPICLSQALRLFALLLLHLECNDGFATFDFLFVHAFVGLKQHALKYKCSTSFIYHPAQ